MVPDHYHQSVNLNTVSVWSWISMMNACNRIFYNTLYNKEFHSTGYVCVNAVVSFQSAINGNAVVVVHVSCSFHRVIYPKYYQTCLQLWRNCYEKDKVRMVSHTHPLTINIMFYPHCIMLSCRNYRTMNIVYYGQNSTNS